MPGHDSRVWDKNVIAFNLLIPHRALGWTSEKRSGHCDHSIGVKIGREAGEPIRKNRQQPSKGGGGAVKSRQAPFKLVFAAQNQKKGASGPQCGSRHTRELTGALSTGNTGGGSETGRRGTKNHRLAECLVLLSHAAQQEEKEEPWNKRCGRIRNKDQQGVTVMTSRKTRAAETDRPRKEEIVFWGDAVRALPN